MCKKNVKYIFKLVHKSIWVKQGRINAEKKEEMVKIKSLVEYDGANTEKLKKKTM